MNREEFLAFRGLVVEPVIIKTQSMNVTLFVRSLNAEEKGRWENQPIIDDPKTSGGIKVSRDRMRSARERLVELALCNEDGSRFCKDGDASIIGQMNGKVVSQLYDVAARLAGISKEDVEDIVKNSESSLTADSASV